jgi:signal transduction histidine kinase
MNILSNAIDALEECGRRQGSCQILTSEEAAQRSNLVRIRTEAIDHNWVRIRFADNGSGIPETALKKLFDPFFTTKPVGSGTGLGLSISYQIVVEKHGGRLECVSQPGQGAEFVIEIPVKPLGQVPVSASMMASA